MYKIIITKLFVIFLLGVHVSSWAQDGDSSKMLTLSEVLKLASENNTEILKANAEEDAAKANNQQANAAFLPSLEVSSGYAVSDDPLYAFGFKLQQQTVTMADFDPNILNSPGQTSHFTTQLTLEQPLINIDAWMGKSAASSQFKATQLKTEYTREYVSYMAKQTYYALQLAINKVRVLKKAQETTSSYLKMAEDNYEQGYLKDADVMAIKVRQYEQDAMLQEAKNQVKTVQESLNFLIGRPLTDESQIADSITQVSFSFNTSTNIYKRSDVLAMQHGIDAHHQMSKSDLMKFAPRINAFGSYNLYDSDFASFGANSYMLGIKLQWRIFNGGKNLGKYKHSKANYNKAQISYQEYVDKGTMELSQAMRSIALAESQLLTYRLASEHAKESLRIRANRYDKGLERTSDLLMAETKSEESVLKQLYAIYNYNMAVFKYQMLVSESELEGSVSDSKN